MNKNRFVRTASFLMLITFAATFVHADSPLLLAIYNSELPPGPGVTKLPDPSQFIIIAPGAPYLLVAKVIDRNGVWLSDYQLTGLRDSITWSVSDRFGNITKMFDTLKGAVCRFTPTRVYDTVTVVATFRPDSLTTYTDTVRFSICTCAQPLRLMIEPNGPINLTSANQLDTLVIQANEQIKSVYAVFRDPFGNFVRYGNIARWVCLDTSIVKVQKGDTLYGEGILTRTQTNLDSITKIYAVDANGAVSDTCVVKHIIGGPFCKLRIVAGNDTNPANLVMNINQDTVLSVQCFCTSNLTWVDVSAVWQNSASLKIDPIAPANHSWRFSPTDTGSGWIRVTMNNDVYMRPDTIAVHFTGGPSGPVRASFEIITPRDSVISGKPILAVVKLYDYWGKGYPYTFDTTAGSRVAYRDALGSGSVSFPEPYIIVDHDTLLLDSITWASGNQTFVNGVDTVSFILFYAPLDTTKVHQLYAKFIIGTDTIHASTTPLVFHNNNTVYAKEKFLYATGMDVPDTLILANATRFYLAGYDIYGNQIGEINGTWSVTGSLHPIAGPTTGSSIYYDPSIIIKGTSESGYIIVTHNGIKDSVYIIANRQSIRDGTAGLMPDKWNITVARGVTSIHIPLHGTHTIKAYSLSGSVVYSSRTSANDAKIKLPKGVFIVSVQTIGNTERFTTKIFNQ